MPRGFLVIAYIVLLQLFVFSSQHFLFTLNLTLYKSELKMTEKKVFFIFLKSFCICNCLTVNSYISVPSHVLFLHFFFSFLFTPLYLIFFLSFFLIFCIFSHLFWFLSILFSLFSLSSIFFFIFSFTFIFPPLSFLFSFFLFSSSFFLSFFFCFFLFLSFFCWYLYLFCVVLSFKFTTTSYNLRSSYKV